MSSADPEKQSKKISTYLRYSHLGMQLFVAVGVFTAGGIWLDRKAGTLVLFTLIGLVLGFSGGFYMLYKELYPRGLRGTERGPTRDGPSAGGDESATSREDDGASNDTENDFGKDTE